MKSKQKPKRQERLDEASLRQCIERALDGRDGWEFEITRHAEYDHPERGFVPADIGITLRYKPWTLEKVVYQGGPRFFGWFYTIKATTIQDRQITILAVANPKKKLVKFITRW